MDETPSTFRHDEDIAFLSVTELLAAYRKRELSPVDVTDAVLCRIRELNGRINAYRLVDEARALELARESEDRWRAGDPKGRLDGVPLSVKDTLLAAGYPCRRGSKATVDQPATESAPIIDRALEHGAVILGITTTPEFGAGPITISPLTGVTRNPWDLSRNSGGSSGGGAASVSAGMGYAALATDAGGSIRIPSALCGVVGIKASGGRIPTYPPNVAGTLSSPGPIARTVSDAALLLTIAAGTDSRDVEATPTSGDDYTDDLEAGVSGLRIAFSPRLGYAPQVHPDVAQLAGDAAQSFERLGATVEEADPGFANPIETFLTLFRSGFAYTLRNLTPEQHDLIGETLRDVLREGARVSLFEYLEAHDARRALALHMTRFHEGYDLLLTPMVSVPAFAADRWVPEEFAEFSDTRAWTPFGYPFNLTQQPAVTVPCGFTREGLPVGLQIVGPKYHDATVLRAAFAYEAARPFAIGRPPL